MKADKSKNSLVKSYANPVEDAPAYYFLSFYLTVIATFGESLIHSEKSPIGILIKRGKIFVFADVHVSSPEH